MAMNLDSKGIKENIKSYKKSGEKMAAGFDHQVHANPWLWVFVAGGISFIFGLAFGSGFSRFFGRTYEAAYDVASDY